MTRIYKVEFNVLVSNYVFDKGEKHVVVKLNGGNAFS